MIDHLPLSVVSNDWRAAQSLQNAYLNFLRMQRGKAIKTRAKTFQRFPRQAGNQIGVDVNSRALAKKSNVVCELVIVLSAADPSADFRVKRLNADLELQRPRWKLRDEFAQDLREPVGNHFEMDEQTGPGAFMEKLQNRFADVEVQVERAVNELESLHAAAEQTLQSIEQRGQRKQTHGNVQGRQAKLAGERAAARGLHVNHTMRCVFVSVSIVRQNQLVQVGQLGGDDLL